MFSDFGINLNFAISVFIFQLLKKICLITCEHLSYNPRLLKEADALHEAGHAVRVVAMRLQADKARWDEQLMARREWKLERVDACRDNLSGRWRWFKAGLRQRLYLRSPRLQRQELGLEKAYSRHFPKLARLAAHEPADLFIAHNLPALPAAAMAARRWQAKLGFDAEDFHRGEFTPEQAKQSLLYPLTVALEEKYVPQCQHLTAASDGIGATYAAALGMRQPVSILNVFPLSERAGHTPAAELQAERAGTGLSLYWYSQVIGGDRGLDDVLRAMALVGDGVHLCLRGTWATGYEPVFWDRAKTLGVEKQIHILPLAPPEQLVERAAQHDVGLALEPGNRPNNRFAASNKLFSYFLAGLAIVATDVPGQRGIMESVPEAGFLFRPGDSAGLAKKLREWLNDPGKLLLAKQQARHFGETRYCWDREKDKLVNAVKQVLGR